MNNYSSNSFVQESIYESQTHQVSKAMMNMNKTQKQSIKQIPVVSTKPDQKAFLKIYQQNIGLKNKQNQLFREIRELKERVNKRDENSKTLLEHQLKQLAKGKKSQWDTLKQPLNKNKGRGTSGNKGLSSTKIQHLLEIIDHYKQKLITSEEEMNNLKRQKFLLEQDLKMKQKRIDSYSQDKPEASNFRQDLNLSEKLKAKIRESEIQKQRTKYLEIQIRGLQAKIRSYQVKVQQFQSIKAQNRSLQQKIMRLTQINSFSDVIDRAEQQRKVKQLQNKLKLLNEKYNSFKDHNIKTQAELKLMQNKYIQATSQINTLQKENATIREQSIHDPIILKIMKNPQMLQKILFQMQQEKNKDNRKDSDRNYKVEVERVILEKEDLAKQLMAYQTKFQNMETTYKERQKLGRLQKDENLVAINQPKSVTSRQGVIYQGDSNAFTEQIGHIPPGTNYFDLFLGQVNILQTMVHSTSGINNLGSPLLLATVDFYNHNTEHSKLTQGYRCDMQSQFSFRVNQDDFFVKFIKKGSFQVDIWASEGNKNYNLGKATIQLKHLASKARPRISPIISTSAPIYLNQKVMGSINIVMRLRLPIYQQLQKMNIVGISNSDNRDQEVVNRRLVIQVEEGRGFGDKSNAFVYYSFRLQDNYTRTSKGNAPNWNFIKLLQVNYDNDFKNFIRKSEIQFIVFDDNVNVMDDKNSDVVGSSVISLLPLLQGKTIKQRLQIKKNNQRKGTIDIKIFWYDVQGNKDTELLKIEEDKKVSIYGLHEEINNFMLEHSIDAEKVYRMMDWNKTGNISYDQFFQWIMNKLSKKFPKEVVNTYYKLFKQPVNLINFSLRINHQLESQKVAVKANENIAAGIGMINEFLKINSTHMKKKSLQQFLSKKNILEVAKQVQTDRLGYISSVKLQEYFDSNNIDCQLQGQKVKLIQFLKKHQQKDIRKTS